MISDNEQPQDSALSSQAPVEVRPEETARKIAVVGEIPFAGSRVARALARRGLAVRVLCPDSAAEQAVLRACAPEGTVAAGAEPQAGIEVVHGDLDSNVEIVKALGGAGGACFVSPVTMAGRAYRPWQHLEDIRRFMAAALVAKIRKVVYHSALGAHARAASCALRDAAAAEETAKVWAAGAEALAASPSFKYYVARTGPLMGPADGFLSEIVRKAKTGLPFMGVLGYGSTLVQPLHVDDFAQCCARFFSEQPEELEAGRYSLAGPDTKTLLELLDMALARLGRKKMKFHAPLFVLGAIAALSPRREPVASGNSQPGSRGGISAPPRAVGLRERLSLLFDVFVAERNDASRLLGPAAALLTLKQTQEEVLAAHISPALPC